jgi:hypothetical protein
MLLIGQILNRNENTSEYQDVSINKNILRIIGTVRMTPLGRHIRSQAIIHLAAAGFPVFTLTIGIRTTSGNVGEPTTAQISTPF